MILYLKQSFYMDKKLFVANWKSHKTKEEAIKFFEFVRDNISHIDLTNKEIIVAPPFTLLAKARYLIDEYKLPIQLAAQNVSSFPEGAYTGEISAKQVKEFAQYVIVGHSERKKYLHESEMDIENKVRESMASDLKVIQCVQDENSVIHEGVKIVAYEPPSAIGSGNPDDPEHIKSVFDSITEERSGLQLIYGGSVNKEFQKGFLDIENLSGFLIGGASLEAESFLSLLTW